MNQRMFHELARERQADMQRLAASREFGSRAAAVQAGVWPTRTWPARRRRSGSACVSASARQVRHAGAGAASRSLRARTGWWLVDLGLKLAVRPDSRRAVSARPAGS